jgi:hypothetical protein
MYASDRKPDLERMGIFRAAVNAMNMTDVVKAVIVSVLRLIQNGGRSQAKFPKRQRTMELDNMAYEPYKLPSHQPSPSPSPQPPQEYAPGMETGHLPEHSMAPQQPYSHLDNQAYGYPSGYPGGQPSNYDYGYPNEPPPRY